MFGNIHLSGFVTVTKLFGYIRWLKLPKYFVSITNGFGYKLPPHAETFRALRGARDRTDYVLTRKRPNSFETALPVGGLSYFRSF
jgi:hypothetical protein